MFVFIECINEDIMYSSLRWPCTNQGFGPFVFAAFRPPFVFATFPRPFVFAGSTLTGVTPFGFDITTFLLGFFLDAARLMTANFAAHSSFFLLLLTAGEELELEHGLFIEVPACPSSFVTAVILVMISSTFSLLFRKAFLKQSAQISFTNTSRWNFAPNCRGERMFLNLSLLYSLFKLSTVAQGLSLKKLRRKVLNLERTSGERPVGTVHFGGSFPMAFRSSSWTSFEVTSMPGFAVA